MTVLKFPKKASFSPLSLQYIHFYLFNIFTIHFWFKTSFLLFFGLQFEVGEKKSSTTKIVDLGIYEFHFMSRVPLVFFTFKLLEKSYWPLKVFGFWVDFFIFRPFFELSEGINTLFFFKNKKMGVDDKLATP